MYRQSQNVLSSLKFDLKGSRVGRKCVNKQSLARVQDSSSVMEFMTNFDCNKTLKDIDYIAINEIIGKIQS